jgi:hypothetical protein
VDEAQYDEPENDVGTGRKADQQFDPGDDGAMSPGMRRLILSYLDSESERVWDADAFSRRVSSAA